MKLFTSVPVDIIPKLSDVLKGIKPWGETANRHPAVLVSAAPFLYDIETPYWDVKFEADPDEVYFDLDDDNEVLDLADIENWEEWEDKSLADLLKRCPGLDLGTGYGLYVKEVPGKSIIEVKLSIILGDWRIHRRVTVFKKGGDEND